jgi:ABC-type branched-subunit amino acid transport system substrate-binding protein
MLTGFARLSRRTLLASMAMLGSLGALPATARAGDITLGLVSPLSEPGDARSGDAIKKTAELWVKLANEAGGINGSQIKLAVYDDQGKVEVGAAAMERAITEAKASAILGIWSSSVALAQMEVAKGYNVPLMAFYSWSDDITLKNYPQVFRIGPYNSQIAAQMVPFVKARGYKKVVVLAEDTAYGLGFAKAFEGAVKALPDVSLDVVQFQAQTQDLTAVMSKVAASKPDVVIVQTVFAATNLSIKQGREVGLKADIITGWDWPLLQDFWPTVGEAGVGVVYPTFSDPSLNVTPTGKKFVAAYKAAYGNDPAIFQYYLWDNFNAVKAAIEKSGSSDPAELVKTLPDGRRSRTAKMLSTLIIIMAIATLLALDARRGMPRTAASSVSQFRLMQRFDQLARHGTVPDRLVGLDDIGLSHGKAGQGDPSGRFPPDQRLQHGDRCRDALIIGALGAHALDRAAGRQFDRDLVAEIHRRDRHVPVASPKGRKRLHRRGIPYGEPTSKRGMRCHHPIDDGGDQLHVCEARDLDHDVWPIGFDPFPEGDLALVGREEVDAVGQHPDHAALRDVGAKQLGRTLAQPEIVTGNDAHIVAAGPKAGRRIVEKHELGPAFGDGPMGVGDGDVADWNTDDARQPLRGQPLQRPDLRAGIETAVNDLDDGGRIVAEGGGHAGDLLPRPVARGRVQDDGNGELAFARALRLVFGKLQFRQRRGALPARTQPPDRHCFNSSQNAASLYGAPAASRHGSGGRGLLSPLPAA